MKNSVHNAQGMQGIEPSLKRCVSSLFALLGPDLHMPQTENAGRQGCLSTDTKKLYEELLELSL